MLINFQWFILEFIPVRMRPTRLYTYWLWRTHPKWLVQLGEQMGDAIGVNGRKLLLVGLNDIINKGPLSIQQMRLSNKRSSSKTTS